MLSENEPYNPNDWKRAVLILILLDHALRAAKSDTLAVNNNVLILILLDHALRGQPT